MPDMGPNTNVTIKIIIIRRLESEIKKKSNIQSYLNFVNNLLSEFTTRYNSI